MKWLKGYIESTGNIIIGAKRENGEIVPIPNQEVFINIDTGTAIKVEKHFNAKLNKEIIHKQIYPSGSGDNNFFLFNDQIELDIDVILNIKEIFEKSEKMVEKKRGKR
jgi:hypothetical protein